MSGMRRGLVVGAVVVIVVVLAVGGWFLFGRSDPDPFAGARPAADAYAQGWQSGSLESMTFAGGMTGADVAARVDAITGKVVPAEGDRPEVVVVDVTPDPADERRGTAQVEVTWTLSEGVQWTYAVPTPLVKEGRAWFVEWSPAAVEPSLQAGEALEADRVPAQRGTILDAEGQPLFQQRAVVTVGIATPKPGVASPTQDQLAATAARVAAVLAPERIDGAALQQRVAAAGPDQFVEVVTLRRERYDQVKPEIYDLPGTAFRQGTRVLAPSATFARPVLGSVGEATAEDIARSDGRIVRGQLVGHGGLQEAFDARLGGTDGVSVQAVPGALDASGARPDASTSTTMVDGSPQAGPPRTLFTKEPVAGADIAVTLDSAVQAKAEAALAGAPKPAAMVVVRPSTGELLAVANGGAGDDGLDRALEGRYPPGSTFKVVSTFALLGKGLTPDEVVPCPPNFDVGGRKFVNAESEALGAVPFRLDFADSCNTAFVSLADRVTDADLAASGSDLGLADDYRLGIPSFGGDVPANSDAVGHAAAMIGQSKVLASPLGMALVASSAGSGTTVTPVLVTDPRTGAPLTPDGQGSEAAGATGTTEAPGTTTPAAGVAPVAPSRGLDPARIATLQELMRGVVTGGTATVLRDVPGGPVSAKTGTAEFGSQVPPQTHAWIIGFQGDLAFAVLVEDGGFGAQAAGPIAASFLASMS
jgi:cell division protein FtsI/penicillin-binding protein 2